MKALPVLQLRLPEHSGKVGVQPNMTVTSSRCGEQKGITLSPAATEAPLLSRPSTAPTHANPRSKRFQPQLATQQTGPLSPTAPAQPPATKRVSAVTPRTEKRGPESPRKEHRHLQVHKDELRESNRQHSSRPSTSRSFPNCPPEQSLPNQVEEVPLSARDGTAKHRRPSAQRDFGEQRDFGGQRDFGSQRGVGGDDGQKRFGDEGKAPGLLQEGIWRIAREDDLEQMLNELPDQFTRLCSVDTAPEEGAIIGSRVFQKCLGEGRFGKVFRVQNIETGQEEAVKVLDKSSIAPNNPQDEARFWYEAKVLSALDHPNVVKLLAVSQEMNHICLHLEMAGQQSLSCLITSLGGKLTPADAKPYFGQLIEGVAHVHSRGYAHRDIKPENIVVDDGHLLRLVDFGSATELSKKHRSRSGTPLFMAPEVLARKIYDAGAADMWSCGSVLLEILAGEGALAHMVGGSQTISAARLKNGCTMTDAFEICLRALLADKAALVHGIESAAGPGAPLELMLLARKLLEADANVRWSAEQARNSAWLKGSSR